MDGISPPYAHVRAPRMQLADLTPAVLRFPDGQRATGDLRVLSVTGGLLSLPSPVDQGSEVKLMFLTHSGAVLGAAEMLSPVTSTQQPFRFVSLPVDDRRRVGAAIQSSLKLNVGSREAVEEKWMEKLRAASSSEKPRKRIFKLAIAGAALGIIGVGCVVYLFQVHALK